MVVNIALSNKVIYFLVGLIVIAAVGGIAIAFDGGQPHIHGHDANEIANLPLPSVGSTFSCPADYTQIGSLGCLENTPRTADTWREAAEDCWNDGEKTLPPLSVIYAAAKDQPTNMTFPPTYE